MSTDIHIIHTLFLNPCIQLYKKLKFVKIALFILKAFRSKFSDTVCAALDPTQVTHLKRPLNQCQKVYESNLVEYRFNIPVPARSNTVFMVLFVNS